MNLSIVVPIYNEEQNLPLLAEAIRKALTDIHKTYECVFVDDGSSDRSAQVLKQIAAADPHHQPVFLRRNFGQTAALSAGFDHARGEIIVTLDADLQNDPADIPMLVSKIEEGYDLVSGWRQSRQDSMIRNLPSYVANWIIGQVTGIKLRDSGCTLKAYRAEVAQSLHLYGEMHRFIPALASWMGINLIEVPVRHHARKFGKSKYGLSRVFRVFLDLITVKFLLSYSASPIQFFGKFGFVSSGLGWLVCAAAIIMKFTQGRTLTGNPLFYLFTFMQIIAVQLVLIGLVAEMNMRTYHEVQKKKTYVVRKDSAGR
jgi:glycosyltransferase involved in cell wall biosynthesis